MSAPHPNRYITDYPALSEAIERWGTTRVGVELGIGNLAATIAANRVRAAYEMAAMQLLASPPVHIDQGRKPRSDVRVHKNAAHAAQEYADLKAANYDYGPILTLVVTGPRDDIQPLYELAKDSVGFAYLLRPAD